MRVKIYIIIYLMSLPGMVVWGQGKMPPSGPPKYDFRFGIELGGSSCFANRVVSELGMVEKVPSAAAPQFGVTLQYRYTFLYVETGWIYHTFFTGYGIDDKAIKSGHVSQSYNDGSYFNEVPLRFSVQKPYGKKKRFSLEPMLGISLLLNRKTGMFMGSTSFGSSKSSKDTISTITQVVAYSVNNRVLAVSLGLRAGFRLKRSVFSLQAGYLAGNKDWRYSEVRYRRDSQLHGAISEKGFIYSKVSCLALSVSYKYVLGKETTPRSFPVYKP